MSTRRIVIAGASGFMGTRFAELYRVRGDQVSTIGRQAGVGHADAAWGDQARIGRLLDGADTLVNLAGKSVNCRYTEANMAEILRSRLETTVELGRVVGIIDNPPPLWFNASTATIYRHADDRPMTESGGEIGTGFSENVATSWEKAFFDAPRDVVRQLALRMAITLGDGSALESLVRLARLGLGGSQLGGKTGGGNQHFSWVHLDDVFHAMTFLETHELDGPVNVSAPNPSTSREFMATLRDVLGVRFGIPLQEWMLRLGSRVIQTEAELILKSRWVLPQRLTEAGFVFQFPELEPALRQILREESSPVA